MGKHRDRGSGAARKRYNAKNPHWIITGVNGEKYPCKPDIFEKTYEKVERDNQTEK